MSNAREFWLKFAEAYGDEDQIFDEKSDHHQKQIHVIEFSAYQALQKENEKLLKFKEEMWKLGQALPPNAISMMIQKELGKL